MDYTIDSISPTELITLNELVKSSLSNEMNPKLGRTEHYLANSTFFRYNHNKDLIDFVNNITGHKKEEINSFFYVRYSKGDKLPRHRDRSNHDIIKNPEHSISYSFLLEMCEDGGEFLLDDVDINFNTPGQYVYFDGEDIFHEIKEVKSGERAVLVVWYSPKRKTTLL